MGITAVFAHDVADAGHDRPAVGLREEINFHFHALTDVIRLLGGQQHAGDAEVDDLAGVPRRFGNRAHTRRPLHMVPAGAALLEAYHVSRHSKIRARGRQRAVRLSHRAIRSTIRTNFVIEDAGHIYPEIFSESA